MTGSKIKKNTIGALFDELEQIVTECEKGEIDLELSMVKFRRGLEVARDLQKKLKVFDNEIVEIKQEFSDVLKPQKESLADISEEEEA